MIRVRIHREVAGTIADKVRAWLDAPEHREVFEDEDLVQYIRDLGDNE